MVEHEEVSAMPATRPAARVQAPGEGAARVAGVKQERGLTPVQPGKRAAPERLNDNRLVFHEMEQFPSPVP